MLTATNIDVSIGETPILKGVSLRVSSGEVLALCGPNGAGKSTLLSVLSSELSPSGGEVSLSGKALAAWSPQALARSRAKLSQESQLTFSFRVSEVVEMGRFPHNTPHLDREIVQRAMARVGIVGLAERFYTSLSGGEKQRVHLARILAQLTSTSEGPKVLLLDEPTSALDLMHQEVALEIAQRLSHEEGFAVIVVLHELNLAASWADRIVLMKEGQITHEGIPREVMTAPILREVYGVDVLLLEHPVTGRPIITASR